jgi:hypothetical protein
MFQENSHLLALRHGSCQTLRGSLRRVSKCEPLRISDCPRLRRLKCGLWLKIDSAKLLRWRKASANLRFGRVGRRSELELEFQIGPLSGGAVCGRFVAIPLHRLRQNPRQFDSRRKLKQKKRSIRAQNNFFQSERALRTYIARLSSAFARQNGVLDSAKQLRREKICCAD